MIKIFKYEISDVTKEFETSYQYGWINILPTIIFRHKYWYMYEFEFIFWKWNRRFEIIRGDLELNS